MFRGIRRSVASRWKCQTVSLWDEILKMPRRSILLLKQGQPALDVFENVMGGRLVRTLYVRPGRVAKLVL